MIYVGGIFYHQKTSVGQHSFFMNKVQYLPDYQAQSIEVCSEKSTRSRLFGWNNGNDQVTCDISTHKESRYGSMKKNVSKYFFVPLGIRSIGHNEVDNFEFEDIFSEVDYVCGQNIDTTDYENEESDIDIPVACAVEQNTIIINAQKYSIVQFSRRMYSTVGF